MMNDEKRNDAYAKAIRNAVSKDDLVLEIGTGSGLLSMIATENTSEKIFSCETSQNITTVAKEVILENGLSDKIDVINKKSTDLLVGKDIPGKVDVIISEILSAELVGEGVRSSILEAKKRLLKDGGKMIPQSGAIKIALICQNEEINKKTSVQKIIDFDLSAFNNLRADKFSLHLNKKPKLLSDAINAFEIDFQNNFEVQNVEKILKIKAIGNGVCIGLIQWLDINIYKDIKYENTPGVINSHWPTPIYLFKNHIELYEGQVLNVRASLFEDSVWFKMI
jgi:type II protein arginine methyltransferase